ncbi:unnamed protein product [Lasius platythorax]|uniref:Uncharacterized protein n=1 Tax=Lasius platythorax TaxID=488582 RepID=A0AAV2NNV8_9HYME
MRIPSVVRRLTLFVLLLYQGNHLAARNEGACKSKLNHDVYDVPSNDFQCQDNASDNDLSVIERYRPTKESYTSNFDTTALLEIVSRDEAKPRVA